MILQDEKVSTNPSIELKIVLFPDPVLPIIPNFSPFSTEKLISFRAYGKFLLYLNETFLNFIS